MLVSHSLSFNVGDAFMRKYIFLILFILNVSGLANMLAAGEADNRVKEDTIYVVPKESQEVTGLIFNDIQGAIDFASGKITSQDVIICIREGDYPLSASLRLPETDGTFQLTIMAAPGEKVTLFGGRMIEPSWFSQVRDRRFIDQLVEQGVKDSIMVADLASHGIKEFGEISPHGWSKEPEGRIPPAMLAVGGQRMTLARWPNPDEESLYLVYEHYLPEKRSLRGYEIRMQEIIDDITIEGHVGLVSVLDPGDNYNPDPFSNAEGGSFRVAFDRMKYWHDIGQVFLDGVLGSTWEWTYNQLKSVNVDDRTITLAEPELHGIGLGSSVRLPHFYFENIVEEIDCEGEFYLDRKKGLLYFYPPANFLTDPIILSTLKDPMVVADHSRSVTFRNLTFDCGRNRAFQLNQVENLLIEGCGRLIFSPNMLVMTNF